VQTAVLVSLVAAPVASAHSVLVATEPAMDAVVEESPNRVVLRFDEPVETALGSLRVYDGSGRRVDAEAIMRPSGREVAVSVEPGLPRGTYTVAWRVISADSDPINGAWVFHVREPGPQPSGIAAEVLEGTPLLVSIVYTGGRFVEFCLLLLCAGGIAALVLVLGRADPGLRRRLYGLVALLAGALAVVALLGIVFQGAAGGGFGLVEAFRWDVFSSVAGTRYGEVALTRAALASALAVVALALRGAEAGRARGLPTTALTLVAGLAVTPSFAGHASIHGPLGIGADLAHVLAAAAWTGGLAFVVLALVLAGGDRWPLAAVSVPRFSTVAVGSVAALIVAGSVNGYLQVRTWSGLWETKYGLLLLAKVALVLPLLALGAYNNRYAVPRLRRQIASALEQRRFLRAATAELAIMVAIVGVTAVLVNAPPARTEVVMHGPIEEEVDFGPVAGHFSVEPGMPGENELRLALEEPRGGGGAAVEEVRFLATLEEQEIGPLRFPARERADGAWVARNATLPLAGDWQLRLEVRRGEFELLTEDIEIEIREEP
jgi:copper transport protein